MMLLLLLACANQEILLNTTTVEEAPCGGGGAVVYRDGRQPITVHRCLDGGCTPSLDWSYTEGALEIHDCAADEDARIVWGAE